MSDSNSLQQVLRRIIDRCPAVSPILHRLALRLAKNGNMSGRMKLGDRLSADTLQELCTLFPNTAIDQRPDGSVYLRLDRAGIAPDESDAWIGTICAVMNVERIDPHENRKTRESILILDRCRLMYSEMIPVWDSLQPNSIQDQAELIRLADAVRFLLSEHDPLGFAELGARCFGNSKALKQNPSLARRLEEWLLILRDDEITDESRRRIWIDHGVVDNPTAIKVTLYGPLVYRKNGERFDWIARLYELGETATLSWDNLRDIEFIERPDGADVITCENETPFAGLVRERIDAVVIYTAGYPNAAVRKVFELLPDAVRAFKHWGDSDLDGLRIADMLHRIHPLRLWRCDLPEIQRHKQHLLSLSDEKRSRAQTFLANHSEFPFAEELSYTIENGWLEQERWYRTF